MRRSLLAPSRFACHVRGVCSWASVPRPVRAHTPTIQPTTRSTSTSSKFETAHEAYHSLSHAVCPLPRAVFRVQGPDALEFLHRTLTNDIRSMEPGELQYNALLNGKGRFSHDMFVLRRRTDDFFVDCGLDQRDGLFKALSRFKIRRKVVLTDISDDFQIWSLMTRETTDPEASAALLAQLNAAPWVDEVCPVGFVDPRYAALGIRVLCPKTQIPNAPNSFAPVGADFVEALSLFHGVPTTTNGGLLTGRTIPLEANLDWLNGVHFHKGCYIGQELVSRTHNIGVVRRRVTPAVLKTRPTAADPSPEATTAELNGETPLGLFDRTFSPRHSFDPLRMESPEPATAPAADAAAEPEGSSQFLDLQPQSDSGMAEPARPRRPLGQLIGAPVGNLAFCRLNVDQWMNLEAQHRELSPVGHPDVLVAPFVPDWWRLEKLDTAQRSDEEP